MAQPYFNPESALPDPNASMFHGPFGVSYQTPLGYQAMGDRRETMAPFLGQSYQSGEADLQQKLLEHREYAGESARAEREAKRKSNTATDLQAALYAPLKGQLERDETSGKIAAMPYKNAVDLETAKQALTAAKGKPAFNAMAMAGGAMEDMDNAKGEAEARQIHENLQQAYQQKYPGEPLTGPLAKPYGPHTKGEYHIAYSAMTHTPEIFAETAKQTQAGQQARLTAKAPHYEERVAGIHEQGATQRAREALEAGKTEDQRLMALNRKPARSAAEESERETLTRNQVDRQINKDIKAPDMTDPVMATQLGQKTMQNYYNAVSQRRIDLLQSKGMPLRMEDLRMRYPNASDEQIRAAARQKNIKISD